MKRIRRLLKTVAFVLALVLVVQILPLSTLATELQNEQMRKQATLNRETEEEPEIVAEVESLRDEYTKHFRLEDGSFVAAIYNEPVHYEKNGEWKEIDNSIQPVQNAVNSFSTNDVSYIVSETSTPVTFPEDIKSGKISISTDDNVITFGAKSNLNNSAVVQTAGLTANSTAVIELVETATDLNETTVTLTPDTQNSAITYSNVFGNASLEYEVTSSMIKESIIVEEKSDEYIYEFSMNFGSYIPVESADGGIEIYETAQSAEPVMAILPPYMFDADGETSYAVTLELVENASDYTLIVEADAGWINSFGRDFPVTIDPTVDLDVSRSDIHDTHVNQNWPGSNYDSDYQIEVGKNGNNLYRTYIKYDLPTLPDCSVVTNAELTLVQNWARSIDSTDLYLNVYQCETDWDENTVTWNNQPIQNLSTATVIDYTNFQNGMSAKYNLTITKIVKDWYENGENYGLMLALSDETVEEKTSFYSSNNLISNYPVVTVSYINNTGVEDYWNYETFAVGDRGTAYVNTYNGAMTYVHSDVSTNGLLAPLSISHVYTNGERNVSGTFNSMSFGKGFKLNLIEKIEESETVLAEKGYPYRYIDADGTVHYFKSTGTANQYCYEFDENVILTKDSGYTLTNPSGTSKIFNGEGYLTKTVDANGNTVEITHTDRIYYAYDGADQLVRLSYNLDNNRLNSITDTAGRNVGYTYDSSGYLTRITYPDGTYTQYQYNTSTSMLTKIINPDNSSISFGYKAVTTPGKTFYRVTSVKTSGTDGTVYDTVTFDYRTNDTYIYNTKGDKVVIAFDNMGRAVNAVKNGKTISAASYYGISDDDTDDSINNTVNKVKNTSDIFAYNHNLNSYTAYHKTFASTVTVTTGADYSSSTDERIFNQTKSTRVGIDSDVAPNTACVYTYLLPNTSGETFTASVYVNIVDTLSAGTAYIKLIALDADDNRIAEVKGEEITTTNNEWKRLSVTMTMPEEDVYNLVAVCGIFDGNGTMYCENVYYEKGEVAGRHNLIANPSFESLYLQTRFNQWGMSYGAEVTTNPDNGTYAVKVPGNLDPDLVPERNAYEYLNISGQAGDTFVLGASAKALCSASGNQGERFFGIRLTFEYLNEVKQVELVEFDENVYDTFQTVMATVVAQYDYNQIIFELCYEYEVNEAIFDDAFLYRDSYGTYYDYDADGKLISARDDNGNKVAYTYNGADLATVTSTSNDLVTQTTSYTYNSTHNLTSSVGSDGVKTTYTYPSSGNKGLPLSVTVSDSSGSLSSTTSYTYTDDYNYLLSVTDPSGAVTRYEYDYGYDITQGIVTGITDPNGNKTSYYYDTQNDMLETVRAGDASTEIFETSFTYDSGNRLSSISGDNSDYYLTYDKFGRTSSVKSSSTNTLATNTYDAKGNLSAVTYANGSVANYGYDEDNRLVTETYDGTLAYEYYYSDEGRLGRVDDNESGVSWNYAYDFAGRTSDVNSSDGRSVEYKYNNKNQVSNFAVSQSGTDLLDIAYEYDSAGRAVGAQVNSMPGAPSQDYTLDGLGRLTKFTSTYSGSNTVSQNYTYVVNGTNQTGRVNTISYLKNGTTSILPQLKYTYDAKGNITHVYENNVLKVRYTYDNHNRLSREDNAYSNETTVYCYYGLNIWYKQIYTLSFTDTLGTSTDADFYAANSTEFPNAVTDYDGETITYDANGNPTTYRGYSMVWTKGRQLAAMSDTQTTLSFKYDHNGIRSKKTVNGVETKYTYVGSTLVSQKTGSEVINFAYTNGGSPYGFTYNGASYFYLLNLQGDVIGIYDNTGTVVVKYAYDAWGKLISTTGSLASTIGIKNPIRYRGYYYDTETGLYYLQSRYYDPETCCFINADSLLIAGDYLQGTNMFAYCLNNPVMYVDYEGQSAVAVAAGGYLTTIATVGAANAWNAVGWALLGVTIVVTVGTVAYTAYQNSKTKTVTETQTSTKTKVLPDVIAKIPSQGAYQLAYVNSEGKLITNSNKMTFVEALTALGVSGATNTLSKIYQFSIDEASNAVTSLADTFKVWGIYANSQEAAKALAIVFGYTAEPKVHGSGYYGHYHDSTHTFHIWYGSPIIY